MIGYLEGLIFDVGADSLILRNAIKIEEIKDPIKPIDILLQKVEHDELCKLY